MIRFRTFEIIFDRNLENVYDRAESAIDRWTRRYEEDNDRKIQIISVNTEIVNDAERYLLITIVYEE